MKGHDGKNLNRNFQMAIYFAAAFSIMALSGCGGGGGTQSQATGTVDGYVYMQKSAKLKEFSVSAEKNAPAGYVAVPGVKVSVSGMSLSATTNANGYFLLQSVPAGTQTLVIAGDGSPTTQLQVSVSEGQVTTASDSTVSLNPKANYFPLEIGNTWVFNVTHTIGPFQDPACFDCRKPTFTDYTATGTGTETWTVTGTRDLNGKQVYVLEAATHKEWNTGVKEDYKSWFYLRWDGQTLYEDGYALYSSDTISSNTLPIALLHPLTLGSTWSPTTQEGSTTVTHSYTVSAYDTLQLSSGSYNAYKITYTNDFGGLGDYQSYTYYASIGPVKKYVSMDGLENWQITDYDPDEPAAGDPCISSGTCEDLNPGVEDTATNDVDIFDDKVDLIGTFSNTENYELSSYSVKSKIVDAEQKQMTEKKAPSFVYIRNTWDTKDKSASAPGTANVSMLIFNSRGYFVGTQEPAQKGRMFKVDVSSLPSGVYFYILQADDKIQSSRLVVIR